MQEPLGLQSWLLCPPHPDSPRSPKSSTPKAAKMKNNNMKRSPRFPTWKRGKEMGKVPLGLPDSFPELPHGLSLWKAPPSPREDPLPPTPTSSYLRQGLHDCVQQRPHAYSHLQQLQHCGTGQCGETPPPPSSTPALGPPPPSTLPFGRAWARERDPWEHTCMKSLASHRAAPAPAPPAAISPCAGVGWGGQAARHQPRAMRSTLMMRMMVGLMGSEALTSISSSVMPMMDSSTMARSSWFHLESPAHSSLSGGGVWWRRGQSWQHK